MKKELILVFLIIISGCGTNTVVFEDYEEEVVLKVNKNFLLGENILLDGTNYRVVSVETYNEIGKNSVSKKTEGIFYMVYLSVENKGIEEGYEFSPGIVLIDGDGNRYDQDLKANFYLDNIMNWDKILLKGGIQEGVVVFELDEPKSGLKLEIRNDWRAVNRVLVDLPGSRIVSRGISDAVVKAREEDELLKAGIN